MSLSLRRTLLFIYVVSGCAGLIFEVALQRELSRAFGVTAWASATVLAAFMTGTTLGAAAIGKWVDRLGQPLQFYAWLEGGIAIAAIFTPAASQLMVRAFAALAMGSDPSSPRVSALRLLLAFAFAFLPAFLMGGTFPALSSALTRPQDLVPKSGRTVATVYTANLLGACGGAAIATYALLPFAGLSRTLWTGASLNLLAAIASFGLARKVPWPLPTEVASTPPPPSITNESWLLVASAWSGFATFAYEVVWTQLVALVIGSSAYAFGLMLATFLLGLMGGSLLVSRFASNRPSWGVLGAVQLGASIAVLATLPMWGEIPNWFVSLSSQVRSFSGREMVRASACLAVLSFPSVLLGLFFPLLLRRSTQEHRVGHSVGKMAAINTVGAALGSLVTGFLLLPIFGSRSLLEFFAVAGCVVAVCCFRRRYLLQVFALGTAAATLILPAWDMGAIASGTNVYFTMPVWARGKVVFSRESVQSGLTTVMEYPVGSGRKTLLTNGKFQGNNQGEMIAQLRFAQIPMLVRHGYQRALLIGVGTGTSLAVLNAAPFEEVEAADLSPDIIEASRVHFGDLNRHVLDTGRARIHFADGRNLLLLSTKQYDLITIEITSIWLAGAADLYNREFYHLVRQHLAPGGVLQQWVQLHHMTRKDLAVILQTIREELPHVVLFSGGRQGQIIASSQPLTIDYPQLRELNSKLQGSFALLGVAGGELLSLYGELGLDEAGVDRWIADTASEQGVAPASLISTDDNLYLEYSTPRSNVLPMSGAQALYQQLAKLGPAHLPLANAEAPGTKELIEGARLLGAGDVKDSLPNLDRALELGAPAIALRDAAVQLQSQPTTP